MLTSMQQLALAHLRKLAGTTARTLTFSELRDSHPDVVASQLVDDPGKVKRLYVLEADPKNGRAVRMTVEDLSAASPSRVPFVQSTGSQAANIGPVLKRTPPKKNGEPGPSPKITATTTKHFCSLAKGSLPWSSYFAELVALLSRSILTTVDGQELQIVNDDNKSSLLVEAIRRIPESKETAYLTIRDSKGRCPGDVPEYRDYLREVLAENKYQTKSATKSADALPCPFCGNDAQLYPNALSGAGINLGNVDRPGAFPGLRQDLAFKAFGLCVDCADLLYIYKNHVMSRFLTVIAGERALVVPEILDGPGYTEDFLAEFEGWTSTRQLGKTSVERDLLEYFSEHSGGSLVLHVLWAKFANKVEKVSGALTDVLPSRLEKLNRACANANEWDDPVYPSLVVEDCSFRLNLSFVSKLLQRPSSAGPRSKKENQSENLAKLRRHLADSLYHGRKMEPGEQIRLFEALLDTALAYLDGCVASGHTGGLLYEGKSKKGDAFLTLAGWIRHVARFLHFLRTMEVLPMIDGDRYQPRYERLKPFFSEGTGVDSPEKAFAFLLGALFGKVIQIQAARGVNVGANALTWLKRLQLRGRDLPEFYLKLRDKLLSYRAEGSEEVRALEAEIAELGAHLGSEIQLDRTGTCYFLLLGQSLSYQVLPTKSQRQENT